MHIFDGPPAATTIKALIESHGGSYSHGSGYYEAGPGERISATKKVVVLEEGSKPIHGMLSDVLKQFGIESIDSLPANAKLFINSTSPNRKIPAGVRVVVLSHEQSAVPTVQVNDQEAESIVDVPSKRKRAEHAPALLVSAGAVDKGPIWASCDSDGWGWQGTLMGYETSPAFVDLKLPAPSPSALVAAFDFDSCLANTSLFRKGPDAWSMMYPSVPDVLRELHGKQYRIVIMSNQAAIGKSTKSKEATIAEKKGRFIGFARKVGLPITILAATASTAIAHDPFRKPAAGMWSFLEANLNKSIKIDRQRSFFCGDACGRKGDHSDSDLQCAKTFGVPFYNEKQMFLENKYRELF